MLWSRLDNDLINDHEFITLEDQIPGGFWMFIHCLTFARIANNQGRILHRGVPMQVRNFATVTRQPVERWARFFEEAFALGIIVQTEFEETLCFQVADWGRWHLPPSALPEATRERVRKHRESKVSSDVTSCNELKRVVTDVTTHSTAQHSIEQQSKEQHQQSTETRAREEVSHGDTAAAAEGWGPVAKVLLELQPGSTGSEKFRQSVARWCSAGQDRASPIDYLTAATYAVAEVRHQWHLGKTVTNPLTYGLTIAQNHLAPATERRIGNEARAKAGLSIAPYVWEPPREQKEAS